MMMRRLFHNADDVNEDALFGDNEENMEDEENEEMSPLTATFSDNNVSGPDLLSSWGAYGSTTVHNVEPIKKRGSSADGNGGGGGSTASLSGLLTSSSSSRSGSESDGGIDERRVFIEDGKNTSGGLCISIDDGGTSSETSSSSSSSAGGEAAAAAAANKSKKRNCPHEFRRLRLACLISTLTPTIGRFVSSTLTYIEDSIFTQRNFKVFVSFVIWYVSYMIMGIVGGTVAYMHFPRTDAPYADALPDYGYDVIPYWCPSIPHAPHGNVQSVVLLVLYGIILGGVVLRWTTWRKWRVRWCRPPLAPFFVVPFLERQDKKRDSDTDAAWGGDGRLILQRLLHLNSLIFLTRTSTVCVTGLPQPNPKCVTVQHYPVTYSNAYHFVVGRGFPPHACGDLIYSGHVGCTLVCMTVLHRHGFLRNGLVRLGVWCVAALGIYCTISCRSHYTVDVILAFYMAYFLGEWYFHRAEGRVDGWAADWIRRLEVKVGTKAKSAPLASSKGDGPLGNDDNDNGDKDDDGNKGDGEFCALPRLAPSR